MRRVVLRTIAMFRGSIMTISVSVAHGQAIRSEHAQRVITTRTATEVLTSRIATEVPIISTEMAVSITHPARKPKK
jgi:hypothetical protein